MRDVSMTEDNGSVSVWDGYKTVCFLKEEACAPRGASEEVIVKREEVIVRILDEILPIEAARLYIEYLELIRSCPRYRTGDAVASQVRGNSEELKGKGLQMKPKKITFRILEGEKVV